MIDFFTVFHLTSVALRIKRKLYGASSTIPLDRGVNKKVIW